MDDLESQKLRIPPNSAFKRWSLPLDLPKPPVCSVHPGRTLELTAAIGISKVKDALLVNSDVSADTPSNGNTIGYRRSRLKSGRLQPLGLHTDPFLSSRTCLGVVTVESRKKFNRSLTAPVTRPDSRRGWEKTPKMPQSFRRVFSANPTTKFEVDARKLMMERQFHEKNNGIDLQEKPEEHSDNLLFPPITSSVPGMKIEITRSDTDKLPHLQQQQLSHVQQEANDNSKRSGHAQDDVDSTDTGVCDTDSSSPTTGTDTIQHKRRRRPSGNTGGKLSHGWSAPQPLYPLKGAFPPITDTKRIRDIKRSDTLPPTNSATDEGIGCLAVDINEILSDT